MYYKKYLLRSNKIRDIFLSHNIYFNPQDSSENRKKEMAKKKTGKLIIAFDALLLTFFYIIDVGSLSIMKISHYVFSQISK